MVSLVMEGRLELLQWTCCLMMTGVIWLVQLVLYPAFRFISEQNFKSFHKFHTTKISYLVDPLMAGEALAAIGLVSKIDVYTVWNIASLSLIWIVTFFVSVPIHARLERGFDAQHIEALIRTNWYRTVLWTCRSLVLLFLLGSRS